MKITDSGVIAPSFLDFTIPSEFARQNLYWILEYGHFYCNSHYSIGRKYLDSFLLIYVLKGRLNVETETIKASAEKDQIVLLDCHYPHTYYCEDSAEFLWFHFSGNNAEAYVEYLNRESGIFFTSEYAARLKTHFESVINNAQATIVNEHRISMYITRILCDLASPDIQMTPMHESLTSAVAYICEHYDEEISLEELADMCGLSVSHFIRSFRKYAGCTPHEYLLSFRLRQSKLMLWSTTDSIDEISVKCGFNSASHFARAFRKQEGITPTQFRKIQF